MDEGRRWQVSRVLCGSVVAWAIAHVVLSGLALWAFYARDFATLRIVLYFLIALSPLALAIAYFEARAYWLGRDDPEVGAAVAGLTIMGGVWLLAWYLG